MDVFNKGAFLGRRCRRNFCSAEALVEVFSMGLLLTNAVLLRNSFSSEALLAGALTTISAKGGVSGVMGDVFGGVLTEAFFEERASTWSLSMNHGRVSDGGVIGGEVFGVVILSGGVHGESVSAEEHVGCGRF